MRRDVFDAALAQRAVAAYIGEAPHPARVLPPASPPRQWRRAGSVPISIGTLRAASQELTPPVITEIELDAPDGVVMFYCLFPVPIGILSTEDWGLTQNGQAYFDRAGPAPGENARLVQDGSGGLEVVT